MGQPVIPNNQALQQQYNLAMQSNLLRAQASQMGGQMLLSPRLATAANNQQQQALMGAAGIAPPLVSSADAAAAGAMLYSTATSLPGMMTHGADFSQYGLMNQTALLDYQAAIDPSAAGTFPDHGYAQCPREAVM